jgi:hypothetical protein
VANDLARIICHLNHVQRVHEFRNPFVSVRGFRRSRGKSAKTPANMSTKDNFAARCFKTNWPGFLARITA